MVVVVVVVVVVHVVVHNVFNVVLGRVLISSCQPPTNGTKCDTAREIDAPQPGVEEPSVYAPVWRE